MTYLIASLKHVLLPAYLTLRKAILYLLYPFIARSKATFDKTKIHKILIIRLDRIGDFVVTTPFLRALRGEFRASKITLLAKNEICDLALKQPWIDNVMRSSGKLGISSFFVLAEEVRGHNFDLIIDCLMDYPFKTALLAYLGRAGYSLGFDIGGRGVFFNLTIPIRNGYRTLAEETLRLLGPLGIKPDKKGTELAVDTKDAESVKLLMSENRISGDDMVIVVHPGGYYPSQRWDPGKFAELIDRLYGSNKVKVVLLGAQAEKELLASIKHMSGRGVMVFSGQTLSMLAAMIDRSALFIGNNSGPLHMAAALKKPTISMMGPTDEKLWRPAGGKNTVIKKELICSPCNLLSCKGHECMSLITVEDVHTAVSERIQEIEAKNG